MFVFYAMFYYRVSKEEIHIGKKDDVVAFSLNSRPRKIHDIKRKRVILYTFRGGLGEAVAFGALAAHLLIQAYFRPNIDSMRFAANVVGVLMLVAVWRYIRRTNRRADALLEAQIEAL